MELLSFTKDGEGREDYAEMRKFETINAAAEALFFGGKEQDIAKESTDDVADIQSKLERQIEQQKIAIEDFEREIDSAKKKAEVIYLYYSEMDAMIKTLKEMGWKEGIGLLKKRNNLVSFNPKKRHSQ